MEIFKMSIIELVNNVKCGKISSYEIVSKYIERIEEIDEKIGAFLYLDKEEALKKAKIVDEKIKNGEKVGKLAGIPFGLKDNMMVDGMKTTCASKMLENYISIYDSTVYEKLKNEDAIIVGKLNMDEFAMGSSNENSAVKNVKNPWDIERVPGGSSGGSAAAVASDELPFALGSDTGGSIRQPAAFCGLVGIKPTYGRVSRYGIVAFGSSLDQAGPFTKNVEDNAYILEILSGEDKNDATSLKDSNVDYTSEIKNGVLGLKIGIPKNAFAEGINVEVAEKVKNAIELFKEMGANVEEVEMQINKYALPVYYIVSSAEASSNLSRFDGIRYGHMTKNYSDLKELYSKSRSEGLGAEVKRRIMLGTYVLSAGYYDAYYKKAEDVRKLIRNEYKQIFKNYDLLITPTAPTTAYKIGEKSSNPLEMYMGDICTVPISIAGVPALSMNCGFDSKNLPVGIQLIGNYLDEKTIYRAAYALENKLNLNKTAEVM